MTKSSRGRQTITDTFKAARDCDLTEIEFRLWVLYRSYDSTGKGAFVSDERIAAHMGKCARTVERARASLITKGHLRQRLQGPNPARHWAVIPAERPDTSVAPRPDTHVEDPTLDPTEDPTPVSSIVRRSTESTDTTPPNPPEGKGDWKAFKNTYPQRSGEQGWVAAQQEWKNNIAAGVVVSDMLAGAMRYLAFCKAEGKVNTRYVKLASNFLDPAKRRWEEPWPITESTTATDEYVDPTHKEWANMVPVLSDRELKAAACPDPKGSYLK